jgi:hypothetical protein
LVWADIRLVNLFAFTLSAVSIGDQEEENTIRTKYV